MTEEYFQVKKNKRKKTRNEDNENNLAILKEHKLISESKKQAIVSEVAGDNSKDKYMMIINMLNPISYGYYGWNSQAANLSYPKDYLCSINNTDLLNNFGMKVSSVAYCKNRITIENIQNCLLLDEKPPKQRNVKETKTLIYKRKLPNKLRDKPMQLVNTTKRPYATTMAPSMYVAQQRGCKLEKIDFLFSGSILGMLHKRKIESLDHKILVQVRKGIIIVEKMVDRKINKNAIGFQFERIISEEVYQKRNNLKRNVHLTEITIDKHKILVSAEVDCIDRNNKPIESKLFGTISKQNDRERYRKLFFQMLSQGSKEVVIGTKEFIEESYYSRIVDIEKYDIADILEKHFEDFSTHDLMHPIIKGLNELKESVHSGLIKDESNCYYQLTFKQTETCDGKRIMVIKPLDMSGTVIESSEYLYDALLSDKTMLRSLKDIKEILNSNIEWSSSNYDSCKCNVY